MPRRSLSIAVEEATAVEEAAAPDSGSGGCLTSGTMYNWRVRAVHHALAAAGKGDGPLSLSDLVQLGHLDQYHYLGTEACDHAAALLGLRAGSTVLDVGSGIGGPARYLAATTGCTVLGVELQDELSVAARELTARVPGLESRVHFLTGDASESTPLMPPFDGGADHFISLLVNLHVPDRRDLLETSYSRLKPGGTFVIEDFVLRSPPTPAEAQVLSELVKACSVTSVDAYTSELHDVGFADVEAVDMSPIWAVWCEARADKYAASEEAAVALHGRDIFESRKLFYRAVADLFASGRVGGVRITGRRRGALEAHLAVARVRMATQAAVAQSADVRILEGGGAFDASALVNGLSAPTPSRAADGAAGAVADVHGHTQATGARVLLGAASAQPPFPWLPSPRVGMHDSLQYHFFLGDLFVALRVFHTHSLQSVTAWAYDAAAPEIGAVELLNSYAALTPSTAAAHEGGTPPTLRLENDDVVIVDGAADGLVRILLRPTDSAAAELLHQGGVDVGPSGRRELCIDAHQGHAYGWMPAGFETDDDRPVIHRPAIEATASWKGEAVRGYGYSKRYHGLYPRHNAWRFIHGVATPTNDEGVPQPGVGEPPTVLWTADATFGDAKYNYFKLLAAECHASGELIESAQVDTYQQQDAAYGVLGGQRACASISEIAKWHSIIGGGGDRMESKYENRLCRLTVTVDGRPTQTGLAYNERCVGTLW